jgi:uncharacterized membrane protein (Fun14 family)
MHYVVNASAMLAEGVLTPGQIKVIRKRSREAMVMLAINTLLCSGILAAALGFVFYLADAAAVAVTGALFLAIGAAILLRGGVLYRMFGTASALIGAGMLSAGASFELLDKLEPDLAGLLIGCLGAIIGFAAFWALRKGAKAVAFVAGSVFLIGVAMHLAGVFIAMEAMNIGGLPAAMVMFYCGCAADHSTRDCALRRDAEHVHRIFSRHLRLLFARTNAKHFANDGAGGAGCRDRQTGDG